MHRTTPPQVVRIEGERQAQEGEIRAEVMAEVQQLLDSSKDQSRAAAERLQQEAAELREQAWQAQVGARQACGAAG
jgi:hypothetical protein